MIQTKIKYNGKKVSLRGFGSNKYTMLRLAQAGLRSIRKRVSRGIGSDGTPMPPLTKNYAKYKRRSDIRDLRLTGKMLENLSVRWASANQAKTALTSRKARIKGLANEQRSPWCSYSPGDQAAIMKAAREDFKDDVSAVAERLIKGGTGRYTRSIKRRKSFQRYDFMGRRVA